MLWEACWSSAGGATHLMIIRPCAESSPNLKMGRVAVDLSVPALLPLKIYLSTSLA